MAKSAANSQVNEIVDGMNIPSISLGGVYSITKGVVARGLMAVYRIFVAGDNYASIAELHSEGMKREQRANLIERFGNLD